MHQQQVARRRSWRLPSYDYTRADAYFVTICTQRRMPTLGCIVGSTMQLSRLGDLVTRCWEAIPEHLPSVQLDAFVVMPNHVRGIIILTGNPVVAPYRALPPRRSALGQVVGTFKGAVTRLARRENADVGVVWQGNYYERVLWNDHELFETQEYIVNNPRQWELDRENPERRERAVVAPYMALQ